MGIEDVIGEESIGDVRVVTVRTAELSAAVAKGFVARVQLSFPSGGSVRVVLDLSSVKFMDSVALGSLVVLLRRVKERGGRMVLVGLSGHCRNVMDVTGLGRVFEQCPDVASAVKALQGPG